MTNSALNYMGTLSNPAIAPSRRSRHGWPVFSAALFVGYLTIPHFIFVYFGQSSLAAGLLVYAFGLLLYTFKKRLVLTPLQLCILSIAGVSIGVHHEGELSRQLLSILVMGVIFVATNCYFRDLESRQDQRLRQIVKLAFFVLCLIGVVGKVIAFRPGNYALRSSVFPFSEPSHYALVFAPIACAYMLQFPKHKQAGVAAVVLLMGLIYPNVTLIAASVLLLMISLRVWAAIVLLVFTCAVVAVIGSGALEKLPQYEYFFDRLGRSDESRNLTYLVYTQGWQQAAIALKETNGIGVGFQRFGQESAGSAAVRIEEYFGQEYNRKDGSNLGSKIIGEFGLLGIVICISMILYAGYSLFILRRYEGVRRVRYFDLVCMSVSGMFLIEVVFRGMSYFSPMLFLYCYAISRAMSSMTHRTRSTPPQPNSLVEGSMVQQID